jgi:hypothetical protein
MMAKTDDVILLQERSYRWLVVANLQTKEGGSLLGQMLYQLVVVSADLYLQTILLKEVGIAEVMIQVAVGSQQVNRLQLLLTEILVDSLTLLWIKGATVDDDTLLAVVTHHIAVLLQRIYLKTLYVNH